MANHRFFWYIPCSLSIMESVKVFVSSLLFVRKSTTSGRSERVRLFVRMGYLDAPNSVIMKPLRTG